MRTFISIRIYSNILKQKLCPKKIYFRTTNYCYLSTNRIIKLSETKTNLLNSSKTKTSKPYLMEEKFWTWTLNDVRNNQLNNELTASGSFSLLRWMWVNTGTSAAAMCGRDVAACAIMSAPRWHFDCCSLKCMQNLRYRLLYRI